MITQLFNGLEKGIKRINQVMLSLVAAIKGVDPRRDELITKRFLRDNKSQSPRPERMNPKNQSMVDSQGISGFSGSGYKGPAGVNHDKVISNREHRPRSV